MSVPYLSNRVVLSLSEIPLLQVDEQVEDAFAPFSDPLADLLVFLVAFVFVYTVGHLLIRPIVLRVARARNRQNLTLVTAMETYVQVFFVVVAAFVGIVVAGYGGVVFNTDSAIVIAALTFTFGVAGQEVLGSLVSGFFLIADPDFNVGDWISWPGGEGVVEAVDFRVTRVRTPDNVTITVPNTELTTNALSRPYGRNSYRITEQVEIGYDGDVERALLELRHIAEAYHRTGESQATAGVDVPIPDARIVDLGAETITVEAELWILNPTSSDVVALRSDVRREIKRRFDEEALPLDPPAGRELSGSVTVPLTEGPASRR